MAFNWNKLKSCSMLWGLLFFCLSICLYRAIWTHGGPTSAFLHIIIALCLLIPRLLIESKLIQNGNLPRGKWKLWLLTVEIVEEINSEKCYNSQKRFSIQKKINAMCNCTGCFKKFTRSFLTHCLIYQFLALLCYKLQGVLKFGHPVSQS